uniref:branched-chain amino acid transport system II carrier protein n=1 Tax=Staphylococcus epidermidis TaxID=1282 RepID=UPI001642E95F
LVGIVVVVGFMGGMGGISDGGVSGDYRNRVLVKGFMDGYNTLHPFPSLPFPIIILTTIKNFPITNPNTIPKQTLKSPTITIIAIPLIYTLLPLIATISLPPFKISENAPIALPQI